MYQNTLVSEERWGAGGGGGRGGGIGHAGGGEGDTSWGSNHHPVVLHANIFRLKMETSTGIKKPRY
jgi:hypothetical protein